MPETHKTLGQSAPAAATDATLYQPGAGKSAVVSTIVVCNTGAAATTFRIHQRIAAAAVGVGNALAYDAPIEGKETVTLTIGLTPNGTDLISCRSLAGGVTFTANGVEIS